MTNAEKILDIARGELGTKEQPANSNNVKYNTWYYGRVVSGSQYPWCMAFVQWVFERAALSLPFLTASCSGLLNWYKKYDPACVIARKDAKPGDIVIFDLPNTAYATDHVGILESASGGTVTTIDGNTGSGNDANGGAVMRRTRNSKYVYAVIRPRELAGETEEPMHIGKLIEEMTPEQAYEIYAKAEAYLARRALPASWDAAGELKEAVAAGITDGSRAMAPCTRLEAAVMVKRARGG